MQNQLNSSGTVIADLRTFFHERGVLHDADIELLAWDPVKRTITLSVDDLNSAFAGLPDYLGPWRVAIRFDGVSNVSLQSDAIKGDIQRIYKLEVTSKLDAIDCEITICLSPSGTLGFTCRAAELTVIP